MLPVTATHHLSVQAPPLSRISSSRVYVAPAAILTADPYRRAKGHSTRRPHEQMPQSLREEASSHGVCYLRIRRRLACGDLYQADVAATLDLLSSRHPLSIFLTEEALFIALTYDRHLETRVQRVGGVQ